MHLLLGYPESLATAVVVDLLCDALWFSRAGDPHRIIEKIPADARGEAAAKRLVDAIVHHLEQNLVWDKGQVEALVGTMNLFLRMEGKAPEEEARLHAAVMRVLPMLDPELRNFVEDGAGR